MNNSRTTAGPRLTRASIVAAAAGVADEGGLTAVSMRNVGRALGVEAMSLYHHVANKQSLLDELADWIFAQIELPQPTDTWRAGMVRRSESTRRVLGAHPWGLGLIESRTTPGPRLLAHHNAVLGCLRAGGFSVRMAGHAFSVIDAYVHGFVLTTQNLPFDAASGDSSSDFAADLAPLISAYPHLGELVTELTGGSDYVFVDEFEYGLGVILDELERRLSGFSGSQR